MRKYLQVVTLLVICLSVFVVMTLLLPGKFLTFLNMQSLGFQIPEFGLFVLAMFIAFLTGGIDLSVISISALCGVTTALILKTFVTANMSSNEILLIILLAVIISILVSLFCGIINGLLIAYIGATPILATLGTGGLFLGASIILTESRPITGFPEKFQFIGNGTLYKIPLSLIIFIICVLILSLILNKTKVGFNIKMFGSNSIASRFAGISNEKTIVITYIITGLLAGIASIIMISRVNSYRTDYGSAYLFAAILVTILGGVNPFGGNGSMIGTILALFILKFLDSGFNLMSFDPFLKKFIWGLMLILVLILNFYLNRRRHGVKSIKKIS